MRLGVTATQHGLTDAQWSRAKGILFTYRFEELHHGDCIGGDEELDALAVSADVPRVAHPPIIPTKRAFCKAEIILPPEDYLDRNQSIVHSVDVMLGFPKGMDEELRSGTWATVRFARKMHRRTLVIYPDGSEQRWFMPQHELAA